MVELKAKCDQLQKRFSPSDRARRRGFRAALKAYGMPRETEEEKAEKSARYGNRIKGCLLRSYGNHGEML